MTILDGARGTALPRPSGSAARLSAHPYAPRAYPRSSKGTTALRRRISEIACARPERGDRRRSALRLAYPPRYDPCAYAREECRGPSEPAGQDAPWWCLQAPHSIASAARFGQLRHPCHGRLTSLGRAPATAQITVLALRGLPIARTVTVLKEDQPSRRPGQPGCPASSSRHSDAPVPQGRFRR